MLARDTVLHHTLRMWETVKSALGLARDIYKPLSGNLLYLYPFFVNISFLYILYLDLFLSEHPLFPCYLDLTLCSTFVGLSGHFSYDNSSLRKFGLMQDSLSVSIDLWSNIIKHKFSIMKPLLSLVVLATNILWVMDPGVFSIPVCLTGIIYCQLSIFIIFNIFLVFFLSVWTLLSFLVL